MNPLYRIAIALCIVGAGLAGCAHQPAEVDTLDTQRLLNAVATDDDRYVQGALRARVLSPNQQVPALGYQNGVPLLTVAARYAALDVMRTLLAAGADINARTPDGDTALMFASFFFHEDRQSNANSNEQHEKAARLLVEAGASIENEPHHYTPLAYAAYQGHDRIVRLLIERGARVDGDADQDEALTYVNTPLMMAAIQGHQETALALLRRGANARIRVRGGHTAAEFAEKNHHYALSRALRCAERLAPEESFSLRCERESSARPQAAQ
jgi:ankyrin repeat protein